MNFRYKMNLLCRRISKRPKIDIKKNKKKVVTRIGLIMKMSILINFDINAGI